MILSIVFYARHAHAGIILQAPRYIGLNSGLVGFWSFDGNSMAGTRAHDMSGNSNHGTLTNGPVRAAGKIGQALSFDGVDDYVNAGSGSSVDNLGPLTYSAWIYPKSFGSSGIGNIVTKSNAASLSKAFNLNRIDISNSIEFYVAFNGVVSAHLSAIAPANSISLNTWQHVVAVWDGTKFRSGVAFYVNGVKLSANAAGTDSDGTTPVDDSIRDFVIGQNLNTSNPFDGFLDDVRIYNRVLTNDEIKRLYRIGATLKVNTTLDGPKSGLVGWWTMDEKNMAGTSAYDTSGQGNTGTLTAGPVRAAGKLGQALSFDGVDDYVDIGDPANGSLDFGTGDMSISFWEKTAVGYVTKQGSSNHLVSKMNDNDLLASYAIAIDSTQKPYFTIKNGTAEAIAQTTSVINDNRWHHIVAIRSGTAINIYLDTVNEGSSTLSGSTSNTEPFRIATDNNDPPTARVFGGLIDDVRVYNRALTPAEIKRLYNIGGTLHVNTSNTGKGGTLAQGLVGWWTFDGNSISGDHAYDQSGNGNRGVLTAGPVRGAGKIGQGLKFDGADDYVIIANPSTFNFGTADFTIFAWTKRATTDSDDEILSKTASGSWESGGKEFYLATAGENHKIAFGAFGVGTKFSNTAILDTNWHHIGVTFTDASDLITFYLDGVLDGTVTSALGADVAGHVVAIGSVNTVGGFFNGLIDDVRIYNRVLTPAEIQRLYNLGR